MPKAYSVEDPDGKLHWIGSFGPWGSWQAEHYRNGWPMEPLWEKRFNQFIKEMAHPPATGNVHLHAFWDQQGGTVYWKVVSRGNSTCRVEGRCIKATLTIEP